MFTILLLVSIWVEESCRSFWKNDKNDKKYSKWSKVKETINWGVPYGMGKISPEKNERYKKNNYDSTFYSWQYEQQNVKQIVEFRV